MTPDKHAFRAICAHCGAEIPIWFGPPERDDTPDEDLHYARWLDSPCANCNTTPRQNGAR